MHPHVTGYRSRIFILEELIAHMKSRPGVWFGTHAEVARYVRAAIALSEKGLDLCPILVAFKGWSEKCSKWPGGAQLTKPHKDCGCRASRAPPIVAGDVEINKLPAMTKQRADITRCTCPLWVNSAVAGSAPVTM